ncbi:MAG: peptidoglycan DD-metalloendopeptidase family protein [Anaerolineales bacterium]|nr:peptidoglycan DD-metalloendopeptidase family protein [Anaerolineales bacterium]MCB9144740.1 peptidoglycan DD-metalloendopeptidase family protein [Anaerolineales bacterium]
MKKLFSSRKTTPEQPMGVPAANEPKTAPRQDQTKGKKTDPFSIISWGITVFLVISLLGGTLYYKSTLPPVVVTVAPQATQETSQSDGSAPIAADPATVTEGDGGFFPTIFRQLQVKTNIPERPRYEPVTYRVVRGDSMYVIAEDFKVTSETILYVNEQLDDNPHSLRPGMELSIPPIDGLYYTWKENDTFESVAKDHFANAQDIIDFTGNQIDLTDPKVEPGTVIFIPGGSRELRNWAADLPTNERGANTGTGGSNAANTCGGGPVAGGFGWPADDHTLSGNAYGPGHLGIDISAPEGVNVYASGAGVVTMAAGGWNYGYGNVVQIDHGNGYVTVYAHLSSIFVSQCQTVGQGTVIGLAGNTGNSFGSHLHFEIRIGGANVNPYTIVQ